MLKNIPGIISPELLNILMKMGHGDEIILADGNFPATNIGNLNYIHCYGLVLPDLLDAVLQLLPLDTGAPPYAICMDAPEALRPLELWRRYDEIIKTHEPSFPGLSSLDKTGFYKRAGAAFAVVRTSDTTRFSNILLRKGLILSK